LLTSRSCSGDDKAAYNYKGETVTVFAAKGETAGELRCPGEFRFSIEDASEFT
jgi:hypothetical protein